MMGCQLISINYVQAVFVYLLFYICKQSYMYSSIIVKKIKSITENISLNYIQNITLFSKIVDSYKE